MSRKAARACLHGSAQHPQLRGSVSFAQKADGVLVTARIHGLPQNSGFLGFHIHSGGSCGGSGEEFFAAALGHYNPSAAMHPNHAGDMPPLIVNGTNAYMTFVTDRFTVDEIIGRTVIVHSMPDDFTTQPSGNSGERIGCGVIV